MNKKDLYKHLFLLTMLALLSFMAGYFSSREIIYDKAFCAGFEQAMSHTKPQEMIPVFYPAYKVEFYAEKISDSTFWLARQGYVGAIPIIEFKGVDGAEVIFQNNIFYTTE